VLGALTWLAFVMLPELALAILVAGFQFYPYGFELMGLETTSTISGGVYVVLTSSALIGTFWRDPARAWRRTKRPITLLFFVMVGYFLVNWFLLSPKSSDSLRKIGYMLVIMVPAFVAAMWLERDRIPVFARWTVFLGFIGAGIALVSRFTGHFPANKRLALHYPGGKPIGFANSVGIAGLLVWITALKGAANRFWVALVLLAFAFSLIIASGTRGAIIALLVSLTLFFILSKRWRRTFLVFLPAVLVFSMVVTPYITFSEPAVSTERIFGKWVTRGPELIFGIGVGEIGEASEQTEMAADETEPGQAPSTVDRYASGRLEIWLASLQEWRQHPLFGVGFGNFRFVNIKDIEFVYAHNGFLEVLSETGMIGAILFVALIIMSVKEAVDHLQRTGWQGVNEWIAFGVFLYAAIASMFSYSITYMSMFWIGMGLIWALEE
jgi:O-antigen ligase